MRIDVLTIFPDFFTSPLRTSLLGRAIALERVHINIHDLRTWTHDTHRTVDAPPYGGGAGMLMRPEPFFEAADELWPAQRPRTLVMTPRGRPFDQAFAEELVQEPHLAFLCGRYEGIDERVHLHLATDEVAVGNAVLGGGEVAAALMIEAITRLIPGVMGNEHSGIEESFSDGLVEHPQYTRPATYRGWSVPSVLTSGDHGAIAAWRYRQAVARTRLVRPDLLRRDND
ncbi:tRNA (guanosine(37)-N1)-methyltransferase TrmD [Stomatohabitans albus]|uniref:tRNA (guanosine(37)-N1)-methyltransferase TrmD n=1 Tax=Stomatohabitans albus TaxID=3110766 RepID=UPI00300C717D